MKHYTILLIIILSIDITSAQDIGQLMQGCNNVYMLEHINLYTKLENEVNYAKKYGYLAPISSHRSLNIENVNTTWLQNITNLVKKNPAILYSYLETDTQNLAAYIILLHVFNIDMPDDLTYHEAFTINSLKKDIKEVELLKQFVGIENKPTGVSDKEYVVNTIWENEISSGVNERIKVAIEEKCNQDVDCDVFNVGWLNNGTISSASGVVNINTVSGSWQGVVQNLEGITTSPGDTLTISLDINANNTNETMRLYIQELDANGNHLSWTIFYSGETKAGLQTFEYKISKGYKAVFYIDKPNPSEPLNFQLDNVNVTT